MGDFTSHGHESKTKPLQAKKNFSAQNLVLAWSRKFYFPDSVLFTCHFFIILNKL